ncbi:dicarboxylate/amino acid:cation symporter [uncultured Alistipes sp.]|uniref:dicarboxylate/amino acid:cation symporter n=1 Tax=uncultured Alistipes sp. TaxID=538949 RepID=UPI0032079530
MKRKFGLLPRVVLAIVLGVVCGCFLPGWAARVALTFNAVFGQFLEFVIPLLIFGLVAPGIADLGRSAGRLLALTVALAYGFTLISGFGTYFVGKALFPSLLAGAEVELPEASEALTPYFTIEMPPVMGVMSALVLAFVLGLGMASIRSVTLKSALDDFKRIIELVVVRVIIPLLPFYIFGIFLSITQSGQVASVLGVFVKLIVVIFLLTVVLLLFQFSVAGLAARRNPLRMLRTMLAAYVTALGTQSSAATIPVTLERTLRLGVRPELASFVIPLCATIHLSGSMMKITACALAVAMIAGLELSAETFAGFILLLAVTMVAAPGVPGGAIMAALGLLESMLGFDETLCGLMIATYIAMDSFGTATNVTGDGAVAVIVDAIDRKRRKER